MRTTLPSAAPSSHLPGLRSEWEPIFGCLRPHPTAGGQQALGRGLPVRGLSWPESFEQTPSSIVGVEVQGRMEVHSTGGQLLTQSLRCVRGLMVGCFSVPLPGPLLRFRKAVPRRKYEDLHALPSPAYRSTATSMRFVFLNVSWRRTARVVSGAAQRSASQSMPKGLK